MVRRAFGCSISRPDISQSNCCHVIGFTSELLRGQRYFPCTTSSLLYRRTYPSGSRKRTLMRSHLFPQVTIMYIAYPSKPCNNYHETRFSYPQMYTTNILPSCFPHTYRKVSKWIRPKWQPIILLAFVLSNHIIINQ